MVALPVRRRLDGLKRSLADYLAQTWTDRELLVVLDAGEPDVAAEVRRHVEALDRADIRLIAPGGKQPLGALRNLAAAEAKSELIAQWDDDDRHHPERLARQAEALVASGGEAIILEHVMHLVAAEQRLYCLNFHYLLEGGLAGTYVGWATAPIVYPESGEHADLGEDSEACWQLKDRGSLRTLADEPHLYVYVTHGANSWNPHHHQMLRERLAVSQGLLRRRELALRAGLEPYAFGAVGVHGPKGLAFTLG